MGYFIFVDNSNLWIEGKYAAAVHNGLASSLEDAHDRGCQDNNWRISFLGLLEFVTDGNLNEIKSAHLYGSEPPDLSKVWAKAEEVNFEVKRELRNAGNKEKIIDTSITNDIATAKYEMAVNGDIFILVMGDGDYQPALEGLRAKGFHTKVYFWSNISERISGIADEFIELDKVIDRITYNS